MMNLPTRIDEVTGIPTLRRAGPGIDHQTTPVQLQQSHNLGEVKLNTRVSTPEEDRDGATEVGTKLKLRVLGNFESRSDH